MPPGHPLPPARGSEAWASSFTRSKGPIGEAGDAASLPDGCQGAPENPAAPLFLLSMYLHCQLPPKYGPPHQITRPSISQVEVMICPGRTA